MRAKMTSKVVAVNRHSTDYVHVQIEAVGKILTDKAGTAKDAYLKGELILKPVFASDIKIGATITVEVNDEEPDSRIE